MRQKLNVINSTLNEVGKKFDYRKKEITFDLFKSFFDNTTFNQDNDGFMGWYKYESSCKSLYVGTAAFDGGNFLDTVIHRNKANNQYNSYVNAIAYWDLLNEKGKSFFLDFYNKEILTTKALKYSKINQLKEQIEYIQQQILAIDKEVEALKEK